MPVDNRFTQQFEELSRERAHLRIERERLHNGDDGGTSGGMSDDWKASVDRQLAQLHGDVRALLYGLIAGFLFLIAAGAAAYVKLSDQIADGQKAISAGQIEQAKASGKLDTLLERTASKSSP